MPSRGATVRARLPFDHMETPRTSVVRGLRGRLLASDADGEIQIDIVISDKAILEVAGEARVRSGVNALAIAPRSSAWVSVDLTTSSGAHPR